MDTSKIADNNVGNGDIEPVIIPAATVRSPRSRVKLSKRVKSRNRKMVCCQCCLQYSNPNPSNFSTASFTDQDQLISSIPCHAVFIFVDPLLLGVIQVEFQNKAKSPLETHPVEIWTFLIAISIYSSVLGLKIHKKNWESSFWSRVLGRGLVITGALSSTSLLSILLPLPLVWLLIILWASIPVIMARQWIKVILGLVFARTLSLIFLARDNLNMLVGCINQWQQHLPR